MWKLIVWIVCILVFLGLAVGAFHHWRVAVRNKNDMEPFMNEKVKLNKNLGKVLVVYYSLSGHTKDIAQRLQKLTGAELFEIKTQEEIKATPSFYMKARQQLQDKQYPKLVEPFPDMSQYDVIFVGAPVWWYAPATPMLSFLENVNFAGKKVVPFSTQGSNFGSFFKDLEENAQNAQILKGEAFNNLPEKYNEAVDNKIVRWLNGL